MVLSVLQDIYSLLEWSSCVLVIPLRWSIGCNTVYTSSYRTEIAGWHPLQHQNRCMLGHPALPGLYIHSPELSPSIHIVNTSQLVYLPSSDLLPLSLCLAPQSPKRDSALLGHSQIFARKNSYAWLQAFIRRYAITKKRFQIAQYNVRWAMQPPWGASSGAGRSVS